MCAHVSVRVSDWFGCADRYSNMSEWKVEFDFGFECEIGMKSLRAISAVWNRNMTNGTQYTANSNVCRDRRVVLLLDLFKTLLFCFLTVDSGRRLDR